jgi:hypothetical protein
VIKEKERRARYARHAKDQPTLKRRHRERRMKGGRATYGLEFLDVSLHGVLFGGPLDLVPGLPLGLADKVDYTSGPYPAS